MVSGVGVGKYEGKVEDDNGEDNDEDVEEIGSLDGVGVNLIAVLNKG